MKNTECYISYTAKYSKETAHKIKAVEKYIFNLMLQDDWFNSAIITNSKYRVTNLQKSKKIIKLLIINLIRANNHGKPLKISLDKNVLSRNNISLRLFAGIIQKLQRMDYIEIIKGYFFGKRKSRTQIKLKGRLKDLMLKFLIVYTEEIKAKFADVTEINGKVKVTFETGRGRIAFFPSDNAIEKIFSAVNENSDYIFTLKINNRGRILTIN